MNLLPFFGHIITTSALSVASVISFFYPVKTVITPSIQQSTESAINNNQKQSSWMDNHTNTKNKSLSKGNNQVGVTPANNTGADISLISATSKITVDGKTINFTMEYPKDGGSIIGNISGDCTGSITGTYNGPSSNTLSGSANATCSEGFLSVTVPITYHGTLSANGKYANITYTASLLGQNESGSTTLTLSQ